jgi:protein-S-isoprenylcysteine O-methyltransferase Ste14
MKKPALPPSSTHLGTNLLGLTCGLLALWLLNDSGFKRLDGLLIVLAAAALPILLLDLFVFKRQREASAGLGALRTADARRIALKFLGLLSLFALTFFGYVIFPEYNDPFYDGFWPFFTMMALASLALSPLYLYWCDRHQDQPKDGYYHLGRLLIGRWRGTDRSEIRRLLRNWLVKAFFLPIMIAYTLDAMQTLYQLPIGRDVTFAVMFAFALQIILFGDLIFSAIGYVLTLRIFNSHIRSSEPTFFGWVVAVVCYPPFWTLLFFSHYFAYEDGLEWQKIIPLGWAQWVWGSTILLLLGIYSLATICLGVRFSNLTYRGLITSGPYRFSKHPAYVAKNLSWWLVSMPFITDAGAWAAFTHSLMLLGVNAIYYFRARTEENHLSNYPEYVAYAEAMNGRSIFVPLTRILPFLKYQKPENPPAI